MKKRRKRKGGSEGDLGAGFRDIAFVLAILMMMTIPFLQPSLPHVLNIQWPRVAGWPAKEFADATIGVGADDVIYFDGRRVGEAGLRAGLKEGQNVWFSGDKDARYETVLRVKKIMMEERIANYAEVVAGGR